jgi:hypothetical protein
LTGKFDLGSECRQFANRLQAMLNRTVTDDARVTALDRSRERGTIATNLDRDLNSRPVALRSASSRYRCWLDIQISLIEHEGYLTVEDSFFGIMSSRDENDILFHFDYQRNKPGYAEAHLQVFGANERLDPMMRELCTRRNKKSMSELHFPVGGRRFRPALEDVIEFLIDEQLAEPKPGWEAALAESRDGFRSIQLKAAVRRHPDVAADALRALGYSVGLVIPPVPAQKGKGKRRTFS